MKRIVSLIAALLATSLFAAAPVQAGDGHQAEKQGNPFAAVPYLGTP